MDFSVVIPTYNSAETIAGTLCSVKIAAKKRKFEIIIVDDCSDDMPYLEKLIEQYPEARLIEKNQKTNASDSRNIGFSESRAEVVFFLDSDDCFAPHYIDHRLRIIQKNRVGVIFGKFIVCQGEKSLKTNIPAYRNGEDMRDYLFLRAGDVRSSTITINKRHHLGSLFDEKMNKHQDWGFSIIACDKGEAIYFDENFGVVINVEEQAKRMSKRQNIPASDYFVKKFLNKEKHRNSFCLRQAISASRSSDNHAVKYFLGLVSYKDITIKQAAKYFLLKVNLFFFILKFKSYVRKAIL